MEFAVGVSGLENNRRDEAIKIPIPATAGMGTLT
jgi:hypothetical protein